MRRWSDTGEEMLKREDSKTEREGSLVREARSEL